jgi:hypothetical protein
MKRRRDPDRDALGIVLGGQPLDRWLDVIEAAARAILDASLLAPAAVAPPAAIDDVVDRASAAAAIRNLSRRPAGSMAASRSSPAVALELERLIPADGVDAAKILRTARALRRAITRGDAVAAARLGVGLGQMATAEHLGPAIDSWLRAIEAGKRGGRPRGPASDQTAEARLWAQQLRWGSPHSDHAVAIAVHAKFGVSIRQAQRWLREDEAGSA